MQCLAEETLIAFADGRLGEQAFAEAEAHVATCAACQDLVIVAMGSAAHQAPALPVEPVGAALLRGLAIGRYTVLGLTGQGGMGEVYAAYDADLNRRVALKLLRARGPSLGAQADARLLREARAMARVSHPNVVTVYDVGTFGGRVFVAMEFIEGSTLKEWLRAKPRAREEILSAFVMAGRGLAAAHAAGLVHRDFKPQNVMMAADETARVMDFGLVAPVGELPEPGGLGADDDPPPRELHLTRTGERLGTPLYMAPEQFKGERTDARTDQFGFCVSLYRALYGEAPFGGGDLESLMKGVLTGEVRPPPARTQVPSWLRAVLLRGLAASPDARWPSMNALVEALERDPKRRLRRWAFAGAAAALVVLAAVAVGRSSSSADVCGGGPARLAGVWEIGEGDPKAPAPRREAVRQAFLATGVPAAAEVWGRVAPILDRYAQGWLAMYGAACEATMVRREQSAATLDLRMACLDERRTALVALTGVLETADRGTVAKAVDAANALPLLDRCTDLSGLRSIVTPPPDAATKARVDALRGRAAVAKALDDTNHPEAVARIQALIAEARAVGYEPLLAELLGVRVSFQDAPTASAALIPIAEEAFDVGLGAGRDDVAADAATALVALVGYYQAHPAEGWRWSRLARAVLKRMPGRHELLESWLLMNEAVLSGVEGRLPEALERFQRSLALKRKVLAPDHPDIARGLNSIAETLHRMGKDAEALPINAEATSLFTKAYGPANTESCMMLANRGEYLVGERADESLPVLEQATACWEAQVGKDHQFVAYPLTALGRAKLASHPPRPAEAVTVLERALKIREAHEPDQALVGETRAALAKARAARADAARP
jgi:tetratricopeptide (TPR) repeat protein